MLYQSIQNVDIFEGAKIEGHLKGHIPLSNQRFQRKFGNPKNVVVFYMLLFFEPSLEPLGKLGFSTILDDSSSSLRERVIYKNSSVIFSVLDSFIMIVCVFLLFN